MRYLVSLFRDMSAMRRRYALRLAGRCVILLIAALLLEIAPSQFDVLEGMRFSAASPGCTCCGSSG